MRYPPVTYKILETLKRCADVQGIAVVGSYATGTQRPDSDIDICAFYDTTLDTRALAHSIANEFNLSVSDVPLTPLGGWGKWVDGGGWLTLEGQRVDIVYRNITRLEWVIKNVNAGEIELDYLQVPAFGYFNFTWVAELQATDPIFDPEGRITRLIDRSTAFPAPLQKKCTELFLHIAQFASDIGKKTFAREEWYTARPCCDRAIWATCVALYAANAVWIPAEKRVMKEIDRLPFVPKGFADRCVQVQKVNLTEQSFMEVNSLIKEAIEESNKALLSEHNRSH
ncbi:MAG: hypothetical protein GF344_13450 [Chitinivibrionales bacterium]|nr:hypothetical protein [Chitinivibrionales bacterium]MBD3357736.1 hypothetical protein [Chitinivibrionales bacterium]